MPIWLVGGMAVWAVCGCQPPDEIEHYRITRVEAAPKQPRAGKPTTRMLAALFTRGDTTWVFKLSGPIREVGKHKATFDKFLDSLRFPDNEQQPPEWTVPEDWRRGEGGVGRFATFQMGPADSPLELTVFRFEGREAADVAANVNRWRGQLALPPAGKAELAKVIQVKRVSGVKGTAVDMTGFGSGKTAMRPPFAGGPAMAARRPAVKFKTPPGWTEVDPGEVRAAAFVVRAGGERAEATVTPLPGLSGRLFQVVNLWREEIKLKPVREAEARRDLKRIEVAGAPADYVDLTGPAGEGQRQRTLGVVLERDNLTWFITLKGPADLVGRQKRAFEAFVKSLRFEEGKGADHE
jgi:hypothetical protein